MARSGSVASWCESIVVIDTDFVFGNTLAMALSGYTAAVHYSAEWDVRDLLAGLHNTCIIMGVRASHKLHSEKSVSPEVKFLLKMRQSWRRLDPIIIYSYSTEDNFVGFPINRFFMYPKHYHYLQLPLSLKQLIASINDSYPIYNDISLDDMLKNIIDLGYIIYDVWHDVYHSVRNRDSNTNQNIERLKMAIPKSLHKDLYIDELALLIAKNSWDEALKILNKISQYLRERSL